MMNSDNVNRPVVQAPPNLSSYAAVVPRRIHWSGIFAGTLAGVVTYLALTVLGFAIGIAGVPSADSVSSIAVPTAIWTVLSLGLSAYLAGLTASRAVGLYGTARGRFNGLITGMVLLALLTTATSSLVTGAVRSALGLANNVANVAGNVVGGAANATGDAVNQSGGLEGFLNNLGLGNAYQSIASGLNEDELNQIIAEAAPDLNQQQVAAATATVGNVVRFAGRQVTANLGDVSNIPDLVNRQVEYVTQNLSGEAFVARLQARGLSQTQATQVEQAIGRRVQELRDQGQQAADAVARTTREATQAAANTASTAAWIFLLASGVILGLATLGGGRGKSDPDEVDVIRTDSTSQSRSV